MARKGLLRKQKLSRRQALSTAGKIAIGVIASGIVAGVAGYYAGGGGAPLKTTTIKEKETVTVTKTVTQTVSGPTVTISPTTTATSVSTTPTATIPTKVELKFAHFYDPALGGPFKVNHDYLLKVYKGFAEEFPNISIKETFYPWDQLDDKMMVAKKVGIPIDLCMASPQVWLKHREVGTFKDLTPYLKTLPKSLIDSIMWNPSWRFKATYPEGIPMNLHVSILVWRRDLFEEAGLDPDVGPSNIDDLIEFAKKTTKPEKGQYGVAMTLGDKIQNFQLVFVPFVWGYGGEIVDEEGKAVFADSPEAVEAVKEINDLFNKYKVASKEESFIPDATEVWKRFLEGKHAINLSYFTGLLAWYESEGMWKGIAPPTEHPVYLKARIGPWPLPTGYGWGHGGWHLCIHANSKHPDEAWEFIKYWIRPEVIADYPDMGIPAHRDLWNKPVYQTEPYRIMFQQAEKVKPLPTSKFYYELCEQTKYMFYEIIIEGKPVKETMKKYQDTFNRKYYG